MVPNKFMTYVILFGAVFFLSTSGIFAKVAQAPSGIIAFYRLLLASLVLWPLVISRPSELQQLLNLSKKQKLLGLLSGSILAIHYVLWFESLHYTSVASSVMLVTLQPLFTIVGCYFLFNERYSLTSLGGCAIALVGCAIISCLLDATNAPEIITSGCGLREGLFYDYYYKLHNEPVVAEDILQKSRENVLGLNSVNKNHARKVNELVLKIFDSWSELHKVGPEYKPLLETAALLHDIGISINFYSHARHSAYMILNAKLFGLTHREQTICAAIAGWHNGASKNYFRSKFYKDMVDEAGWEIITKLACMLAIAESLDYTETNQVKTLIPIYEKRTAKLIIEANGPLNVELQQLRTHLKWFKKTFNVPLVLEIDQQLIS